MIETRFQPFDVEALVREVSGTPADKAKALAAYAREKLVEAQQINRNAIGRVPEHSTFVDGVRSEVLEKVRPNGTIVFEFELASDVVQYCFAMVREHSPVLRGRYYFSHKIFADGVEVATPEDAAGADEVVILPLVPYARKIEGSGRRPPQSIKAPKGVYQVVAVMAARRYGNVARVRYTLREPIGGATALEAWARKNAGRQEGATKQRRQYAKNVRQPALVITFR